MRGEGFAPKVLGAQMIRKASSYSCLSLGVSAALLVLTQVAPAHAEDINPTPKGIIGGGLLGAEVVMLGEAAFGMKSGLGVCHRRHRRSGRRRARWPLHRRRSRPENQRLHARRRNGSRHPDHGGHPASHCLLTPRGLHRRQAGQRGPRARAASPCTRRSSRSRVPQSGAHSLFITIGSRPS